MKEQNALQARNGKQAAKHLASLNLESLRTIKLFSQLSEQELGRVLEVSELHHLAPKTEMALDMGLPRRVLFVLEGACRMLALSPRGVGITLHDLLKGESAGLAAAVHDYSFRHHAARLICERGAVLVSIEARQFRVLMEAMPALYVATCTAVCATLSELSCRYYELATLDVRGRLLGELSRIAAGAECVDGELHLDAAPTHLELAEKVGAAREAVTRSLQNLEREQVIEVGRRRLVIKDPVRLRQLDEQAGGARAYLWES